MSSDQAITLSNVSKHYLMYQRPEDRLKQMIIPKLQRMVSGSATNYYTEFIAVRDMTFEIGRGETVGVIGRNGSGKSTLLQMICGTLTPSSGQIRVDGRIAALLELGAGFNPEFTGRENVYLNASILGLSRSETDARFSSIEAFADIGSFIDRPVKTYSSGMYVRLAFAVAINVDPDILIVDEALSVGDEAFQRKCFARIEAIREKGATILFVSHSAQSIIQLCDKAILMDAGEMLLQGRPKLVVNQYQRLINLPFEEVAAAREAIKAMDGWRDAPTLEHDDEDEEADAAKSETEAEVEDDDALKPWFDLNFKSVSAVSYREQGATISDIEIRTLDMEPVNNLVMGEPYIYSYRITFDKDVEKTSFAMLIKTVKGVEIAGQASHGIGEGDSFRKGDVVDVKFQFNCWFMPDVYMCNCGVYTNAGGEFRQLHRILDATIFRVMPPEKPLKRIGLIDIASGAESFTMTRAADVAASAKGQGAKVKAVS